MNVVLAAAILIAYLIALGFLIGTGWKLADRKWGE